MKWFVFNMIFLPRRAKKAATQARKYYYKFRFSLFVIAVVTKSSGQKIRGATSKMPFSPYGGSSHETRKLLKIREGPSKVLTGTIYYYTFHYQGYLPLRSRSL